MDALVSKHGACVDCKDDSDSTPLMVLAQAGHHAEMKALIQRLHADLRSTDHNGMTCLHHAAHLGHSKCVEVSREEEEFFFCYHFLHLVHEFFFPLM